MSAIVLILAKCLGDFAVAYVLGIPVRYDVLATSLYRNIRSGQTGAAAVLAGAIILIGTITLLVDVMMARQAQRFVTIGSKAGLERRRRLGPWRGPATVGAGLVFGLSAVVPAATLLLSTLMRVPGRFSWDNFSLDAWIGTNLSTVALPQGILRTPDFWAAAWNTVWIVGSAALIAGVLGQLVGYVVARCPIRLVAAIVRQITFLPYLVPGIAFAVAYLSLFAVPRGPIPALYGTGAILMLALIADQMPFASRAGISAMAQLGREPEEAAQVAGARWWTRLSRVVAPIQKGAFASGVLMPFISGIKGVSLVVILAVPGTDLLTTYSLRLLDYAYYQAANAVVLMLSGLALFGTLLVQRLSGTRLGDGLSAG
jgi:iron(III) transport system permease protein